METEAKQSKVNPEVDPSAEEANKLETKGHTVETKVFGIPLVLKEILKHLATPDLMEYRFVQSLWCDIATTVLIQTRSDNSISFAFNPECSTYTKFVDYAAPNHDYDGDANDEDEEYSEFTLQKLTQLITTSSSHSKFPATHFHFREGALGHPDFQQFLNAHGKQIKGLNLDEVALGPFVEESSDDDDDNDDKENGDDPTFLRSLLLTQCPNLETLETTEMPNFPTEDNGGLFPPSIYGTVCLPHLKTLKVGTFYPDDGQELRGGYVSDILEAATNLVDIKFKDKSELNNLIYCHETLKRIHLVQEFKCGPRLSDWNKLESNWNKLSKYPLQLKYLEIAMPTTFYPSDDDEVVQNQSFLASLSIILESSKNTLEILRVDDPADFGLLPGLTWPAGGFSKMKTLILRIYSTMISRKTDRGFKDGLYSFSQLFPNLTTLRIWGHLGDQLKLAPCFGEMFTETEILPNVTRLIIIECTRVDKEFLDSLIRVCPNVRQLGLSHVKRLCRLGGVMWKFRKLTSLVLELPIDGRLWEGLEDSTSNENRYPMLDSVFTGFSQNNVQRLCGEPERVGGAWNQERILPSILDCLSLQSIDILFYDSVKSGAHFREFRDHDLLSKVSVDHAFSMVAGLQVTLSVRTRRYYADDTLSDESSLCSDTYEDDDQYFRRRWSSGGSQAKEYTPYGYIQKLENSLKSLTTGSSNVRVVPPNQHRAAVLHYFTV